MIIGVYQFASTGDITSNLKKIRVIGQKVLIKTAVAIEISMVMAVLSCF